MQHNSPIIINVPHASTFIPKEDLEFFNQDRLKHELLVMTDHYCDDLFDTGFTLVKAKVSRIVCDTERFRTDSDEIMSKKGMGAVYTACSDGKALREITEVHREAILKRHYDTYHAILTDTVTKTLKDCGYCLIIDGHSFYPNPLPYEYDRNTNRADICIGTDDYHTPQCVTDYMVREFADKGYTVSINSPFSGTMVPLKYYGRDKCVMSVMVEINRKLYIDENAKKTEGYMKLKTDIQLVISNLAEKIDRLKSNELFTN